MLCRARADGCMLGCLGRRAPRHASTWRQRRPDAAARCARELAAAHAAVAPSLRAPEATGDWLRGWQRPAARVLNTSCRERLLPSLHAHARALLRSQSGAQTGEWLRAIPADAGSTLVPLRRRLRLPLPLAAARCGGAGELAVVPASTRSAITALLAPAAACWPDEPRSSSARGCGSLARLSALKAALCPSTGLCTLPRLESQPMIGAGSTSSCMAPPGEARRCAAMSRSCHPCARMGGCSREAATAPLSRSHGAANSRGNPKWCWRLRSLADGAARPTTPPPCSLAVAASYPHCALPPRQAGGAAGGGSWAVRSRAPWRPPSWAARGARMRASAQPGKEQQNKMNGRWQSF